jgi:predicted signal transduction protein with EAL and GGDEF domain
MYEAKRSSVGVVRYVRADEHASRRRLTLAGELRRAIDEGQMVVHYQPQLSLADGTITGYEALARWEHPVRGLLTPDEFIPIAEQTGLITALTHDDPRQALHRCRDWQVRAAGRPGRGQPVHPGPARPQRHAQACRAARRDRSRPRPAHPRDHREQHHR